MGGIPINYPLRANFPGQVMVAGSFRPNGSSALVATAVKGNGFSIARTSVGLYTVTFDADVTFPTKVSVLTGIRNASAKGIIVQGGDYSAANRTLQLRTVEALGNSLIHLPLGAFQEQDGTTLADFSAGPTPGWSAGDESGGIRWGAHANPDPVSTQLLWPKHLDESVDATLHVIAAKVGATIGDAVTWKVELFNNVVGALYDADADFGGTSSAMTGDAATKTVQDETLTITAANLPTGPAVSTMTIQPTDGTLGTDDVILLGAYIECTQSGLVDLAADVDAEVSFCVIADNDQVEATGDL